MQTGKLIPQSTVFNNPEDSDIVLEYNGKRVHAHRAILRMASPFFERIFQSQWPVCNIELLRFLILIKCR